MSLQGQVQSTAEKKTKAAEGEEEDLNQLAQTTLAGVKPNLLPPEPFPSGFDLSALASSRGSRPPPAPAIGAGVGTGTEDTGGRIDLRALVQSAAPAATTANGATATNGTTVATPSKPPSRTLPPRKVGGPRVSVPAAPFALAAPAAPRANELDELIASRAFSPGSQLSSHAAQVVALVKRAPTWTWVLAAGVAIGLALGSSGSDDAAAPSASGLTSVASASDSQAAPSLPLAATALPQIAGAPRARTAPRMAAAIGQRRAPGTAAAASDEAPTVAAPAAPGVPAAVSGEERTIDTLLDQAIGGRALAVAPAPAPRARVDSDLPDLPARDAVASVMSGLHNRIHFCAGDRSGVATASVVVKNDGRVSSARINGAPFSRTAAGRCMESVIRGARFPRFAQPTFKMSYPFQL